MAPSEVKRAIRLRAIGRPAHSIDGVLREASGQTFARNNRKVGRPLAKSATATRACPKFGETFEPCKIGRPRIYCPLRTPRKPEDVAASKERYWRLEDEKRKEHNGRLRDEVRQQRETVNSYRRKMGSPPLPHESLANAVWKRTTIKPRSSASAICRTPTICREPSGPRLYPRFVKLS
jgi:hypothetical protein